MAKAVILSDETIARLDALKAVSGLSYDGEVRLALGLAQNPNKRPPLKRSVSIFAAMAVGETVKIPWVWRTPPQDPPGPEIDEPALNAKHLHDALNSEIRKTGKKFKHSRDYYNMVVTRIS